MVMDRQQVHQRALNMNSQAMEQLERRIDRCLVGNYQGKGNVSIPSGGPYDHQTTPAYIIETVLDKYRQTGWQVQLKHDQREGTWAEFKANDDNHYYGVEKR